MGCFSKCFYDEDEYLNGPAKKRALKGQGGMPPFGGEFDPLNGGFPPQDQDMLGGGLDGMMGNDEFGNGGMPQGGEAFPNEEFQAYRPPGMGNGEIPGMGGPSSNMPAGMNINIGNGAGMPPAGANTQMMPYGSNPAQNQMAVQIPPQMQMMGANPMMSMMPYGMPYPMYGMPYGMQPPQASQGPSQTSSTGRTILAQNGNFILV